MADISICLIPECRKAVKVKSSGLCNMHYKRVRRNGAPVCKVTPKNGKRAFFDSVVLPCTAEDCLIWPFPFPRNARPHMNRDGRTVSVSRFVCELIYGPAPSPTHQAAHSCGKGDKGCVNPKHLRWATPRENCADMLDHGTRLCGELHPSAKLSEADVLAIRKFKGKMTRPAIARMFGVSRAAIDRIFSGRAWAQGRNQDCG